MPARLFGTPSYYVQEMFGQNRGDAVLPATVVVTTNVASSAVHGAIGVGSWNTSVQYTNIVVTSNGVTLYQSDFVNQGTNGWSVFNGTWSTNNGLYQQTAQITDCYSTYINNNSTNWANYTITLQARKTGGAEGFLIMFNVLDNNDWTWWNIGGWSDTLDGIEQMVGGTKTTYAQVSQSIATNTWYYIRIVVTGARAQCYLGTNSVQVATNLVQDVTLPSPTSGLLVSSTYANAAGQVIVKAVNPYSTPLATTFNVTGVNAIAPNATLIQLTSGSSADANSLASPTYVFPVTNSIANVGNQFHADAAGQFALHPPAQRQRHQHLHQPVCCNSLRPSPTAQRSPPRSGASSPATGLISPPTPIMPSSGPRQTPTLRRWTSTATSRAWARARRASSPLTRVWGCPPRKPFRSSCSGDARASLQLQRNSGTNAADSVGGAALERHAARRRHFGRRATGFGGSQFAICPTAGGNFEQLHGGDHRGLGQFWHASQCLLLLRFRQHQREQRRDNIFSASP